MSQAQQHESGCPALGGYGHGKEECACGAQQQPSNPLIDAARGRDTRQPPALLYAAALECMEHEGMHKAAAELRRLHARVQELEAQQ